MNRGSFQKSMYIHLLKTLLKALFRLDLVHLNIPFEKTIETGQVGHFHRADCSVVPPRLVTISGAVVY